MSHLCIAIVCVLSLQHPGNLAAVEGTDNISTFGGTGDPGFSGDGGPVNEAELTSPSDLFLDEKGVLYIVGDGRIRRVGLDGIITTIAGTGERGFSGDGGLATDATLRPSDVAVDSKGNIYIADPGNDRIRVVTVRIIDTLAGSGFEEMAYSGDGGPANQAELNRPSGVAVDADGINVYIADNLNNVIRRVGPDGILALTVTSLAFDTTGVGGSSEQTLEVSNIGTGSLTLTGFTFSGAGRRDYQGQETLPTIDAGGIETVTVIFTPAEKGNVRPSCLWNPMPGTKGST